MGKENITDTAATLIEDEIRLRVFDTSKCPKFAAMADSDLARPLLLRLSSCVISSKSNVQNRAKHFPTALLRQFADGLSR